MEDRVRHRSQRVLIPSLTLVTLVAAVWLRADIKAGLRMLGFSAYLAATGRRLPDPALVREAHRACQGQDELVPYWGNWRRDNGEPPSPGPARELTEVRT